LKISGSYGGEYECESLLGCRIALCSLVGVDRRFRGAFLMFREITYILYYAFRYPPVVLFEGNLVAFRHILVTLEISYISEGAWDVLAFRT
jgi:hypothetical protein